MTRTVVLLGLGVEGRAAARYFSDAGWDVVAADREPPRDLGLERAALTDEAGAAGRLASADLFLRSPGVPPAHALVRAAIDRGLTVTTPTGFWLGTAAPTSTLTVTGTKGKSTTVALTVALLEALGADSAPFGNIARPPLDAGPAPGGTPVVELSSYMLHDVLRGPYRHHLTTLFREHTPWHGSEAAYRAAKLRPFRFSPPRPGLAPRSVIEAEGLTTAVSAIEDVIPRRSDGVLLVGDVPLDAARIDARFGAVALSAALRMALGMLNDRFNGEALVEAARTALPTFAGLPSRLEPVPSTDGRAWINDALATIPEAVMSAIAGITDGPVTLLLGGADRGQDFTMLGEVLRQRRDVHAVPFGSTTQGVAAALGHAVPMTPATDFEDALVTANRLTARGGTILFSPAAATEAPHKDYRERAALFRDAARNAG